MIERYFRVKNFRNIGMDDFETLNLNYVLNKNDKMGNLVTLIGMNNSGKSNYLDALLHLGNHKLSQNDVPLFNFSEDKSPIVTMWLVDHDLDTSYEYTYKDQTVILEKKVKGSKVNFKKAEEKVINDDNLQEFYTDNFSNEEIRLLNKVLSSTTQVRIKKNIRNMLNNNIYVTDMESVFEELTANPNRKKLYISRLGEANYYKLVNLFKKALNKSESEEEFDLINREVKEKYHINLIPKIIKYDDTNKIKEADTLVYINDGKPADNEFFKLVFSYLDDVSYDDFLDAYKKFFESNKVRYIHLTNFKRKVNKALDKLSNKFNKVYGSDKNTRYSFRFEIQNNATYFVLSEGTQDIPLDTQSTGFKWFFNFFFNVFANENIQNGDIVILDEPATNLHVLGQKELRKQIKEFGLKTGITFVISTHSPFLIEPDHLDELRLVVKEDYSSRILNYFTNDFDGDNTADTLLPIYSALTVDQHIIMDPHNTLIFVEGITDYNYLTAFKHLFNFQSLNFIPFQGPKNKNLIQSLLKMSENPIVLVDSDKAGDDFINKYGKNPALEIHELKEIDANWKEMEDLFSAQDQKLLNTSDKKYRLSSYVKNHTDSISKQITVKTKENFKKLLNFLEN